MKSFTTKSPFNEDTADNLRYYSNSVYKLYQAVKDCSFISRETRSAIVDCFQSLDRASKCIYDDLRSRDCACSVDTTYFENL